MSYSWGGALVYEGGYHPHKKVHVIRVIFQDQMMYVRTSLCAHHLGVQNMPNWGKRVCFGACLQILVKVPVIISRHFTHIASVTSVNAEANVHSADWLMRDFVNELGSQGPAPCTQSTSLVRAAVPKNYERDFSMMDKSRKNMKKRVFRVCLPT